MFVFNNERRNQFMTEKEKEMFKIIFENDNPEQALVTAVKTILFFLTQHESSEEPYLACLQVQA